MGWILAAVFAVLSLVLYLRSPAEAASSLPPAPSPEPPSPSTPSAGEREVDALRATLGFLRRAVLPDLTAARASLPASPAEAESLLDEALDALEDLAFYAEPLPGEEVEASDLAQTVQEAVRQYTIETRIPVRVHPPSRAVVTPMRREALKDAVFMLLANAGQYSGGKPIDVYLEAPDSEADPGFRIRVADEGPGFSDEALAHALDPFWSTDPRGVGLGLPQARARVATMKGHLSLRNRGTGGGEVVVEVP